MTKEELLSVPKRKWNETLHGVRAVYIIPSDNIHDSGYACFNFVAVKGEKMNKYVGFGGNCDVVRCRKGLDIRFDCEPDNGCVRLWSENPFSISPDLSTIEFY